MLVLDERTCDAFLFAEADKGLMQSLVPLAIDDPVLRASLIALAARHLANGGRSLHKVKAMESSEGTWTHHDALLFKHRALDALSQSLRNPTALEKITTVASVFLLILLDLHESGSSGWQHHLEGAMNLLNPGRPQVETTSVVYANHLRQERVLREFLTKKIYLYAINLSSLASKLS